ncbi:uncharacterized protein LOC112689781 isoform X2 [Sipha flava]|nr:uncharacterized protein LOC112689781 isoform X2 [Sipha flava]
MSYDNDAMSVRRAVMTSIVSGACVTHGRWCVPPPPGRPCPVSSDDSATTCDDWIGIGSSRTPYDLKTKCALKKKNSIIHYIVRSNNNCCESICRAADTGCCCCVHHCNTPPYNSSHRWLRSTRPTANVTEKTAKQTLSFEFRRLCLHSYKLRA